MEPFPDPRVAEAERRAGGLAVGFLTVIGVWLLVAPLLPELTGYAWMSRVLGGDGGIARFFLGFLFLYFGGVVRDKNQLRQTLTGFMKIIRQQIGGGDPEQDRAAVDILLTALNSDKPEVKEKALYNLKRLTGQDLGSDPEPWKAWWKGARASFERPKQGLGGPSAGD